MYGSGDGSEKAVGKMGPNGVTVVIGPIDCGCWNRTGSFEELEGCLAMKPFQAFAELGGAFSR